MDLSGFYGYCDAQNIGPSGRIELTLKTVNNQLIEKSLQKLEYFGLTMLHQKYFLLQNFLQGRIDGKWRRILWLQNLQQWYEQCAFVYRKVIDIIQITLMGRQL